MTAADLNEQTRSEWRKLGYYYCYDDGVSTWFVRGSRCGLEQFCCDVRNYAADSNHSGISEHEHYGPYSYLKLVTWNEAKITADGIYGRLEDFVRLAQVIERKCSQADTGATIAIENEYSRHNEARLALTIMKDDFDPASEDSSLV